MEIKNFTITKRDGSKDRFSLDKIMNAIIKAFQSVDEPSDLGTISKILSHLDIHDDITVEDIQNQVEEALMHEGQLPHAFRDFLPPALLLSQRRAALISSANSSFPMPSMIYAWESFPRVKACSR